MWLKIVSFVCFTAPLVVSRREASENHVRRLQSHKHAVEALAFPLLVRQEQAPRNDSKSLAPSITRWTLHTVAIASTSSTGKENMPSSQSSGSMTFVPTTPTSVQPSEPTHSPGTTGFNSSLELGASSIRHPAYSISELSSPPGTLDNGPNTRQHDSTSDVIQHSTSSEVSQKVTTPPRMTGTPILNTDTPFDTSHSPSASAVIVNSASRDTLSPVAISNQTSFSQPNSIKTWYSTSSIASSTSSTASSTSSTASLTSSIASSTSSIASPTSNFVSPSVVTTAVSLVASVAPWISTSAQSSQNVHVPSPSLVSNLVNTTSYRSSYSTASGTGALKLPSSSTIWLVISSDESYTTPLHTPTTSAGVAHWSPPPKSNTSLSMTALSASSSLSPVITTALHSADTSVVFTPSMDAHSQQASSVTLATITTTTISINSTSSIAHPPPSGIGSEHQVSSTTSIVRVASPTLFFHGTALSTKLVYSPGETGLGASYSSPVPIWSNSTAPVSVLNMTAAYDSTALADNFVPTTSPGARPASTPAASNSDDTASRTITTVFSPSSSASEIPAVSPPLSAPLTPSQTAGAAVAGAAGLLIAVVAAIYIARRYRIKHQRRTSTGSIYPKVAYLYDPPAGASSSCADLEGSYMSGGATDTPLDRRNTTILPQPPNYAHQDGIIEPPMRFSDPGNPFRDPENCFEYSNEYIKHSAQRPAGTITAFSATTKGYRPASQDSPTLANFTATPSMKDSTWPSPMLSTITDGKSEMASRYSILSEITSMAYNADSYSSTLRHQPSSRFDLRSNLSLPYVRETMYTDSCRDPFEHDILLHVDTRKGTPDSMTLIASPAPYDRPTRSLVPTKLHSKNPWASSMPNPTQAQCRFQPDRGLTINCPISSDSTIVPESFSPMYEVRSPTTTHVSASPNKSHYPSASVSPPTRALHRGWDDIKRSSIERVVPSMPDLNVLREFPSPPPKKKTSLPYFRGRDSVPMG